MDYGLKISKPGEDVNLNPDSYANIKKFSLLSSVGVAGAGFTLLKVKTAQKVNISYDEIKTIPHGLGYTPIVWLFINKSDNLYPVYNDTSGTYMYVDGTNLVIKNHELSDWPDGDSDFYYYIFYDQI